MSPHASIRFTGRPDPKADLWTGTISVGDVIIAEHTGTLDEVTDELTQRLGKLSTAVLAHLGRATDHLLALSAKDENGQDPEDPGHSPSDDEK